MSGTESDAPLFESDYNGPYYASTLVATTIALMVLSLLAVGTRFYVRLRMVKLLGADDWMLLIGLILSFIFDVYVFKCVEAGLGGDVSKIDLTEYVNLLHYSAIFRPVWIVTVLFVKLSLGYMLLRICTKNVYRYFVWAAMGTSTILNAVLFIAYLASCRPYSASWRQAEDPSLASKCFSPTVFENLSWTFFATDIFYNFLFALMPLPMLWSLQMNIRLKLSIMVLLALGILASVASVFRLFYALRQSNSEDVGEALARLSPLVILWTVIEIKLGIIIAGMQACKPLFRNVLQLVTRFTSSGSHQRTLPIRHGNGTVLSNRHTLPDGGDSTRDLASNFDDRSPSSEAVKLSRLNSESEMLDDVCMEEHVYGKV